MRVAWLLVAALPGAAWAADPPAAEVAGAVVDRVAAVVNDDVVLLSEIYDFAGPYVQQAVEASGEGSRHVAESEVLARLLERKLVEQEMTALKLDLTEQEVDRAVADIAERNGLDVDGLRREVERSGMPWDQYRSEMKESLRDMKFAQSVLRPRITVTEDELRDAYQRLSGSAPQSVRVQALVLAVPGGASEADRDAVVARARALRDQANQGADFGQLAREHDEGPFGEHDGEMGVFQPGELVDQLDAVIVGGPVGEVSEPIVLGDAVYLLRVAERTSGASDFESRRGEVENVVFQSRLEDEKKRWFREARRRASIRVLAPGLTFGG